MRDENSLTKQKLLRHFPESLEVIDSVMLKSQDIVLSPAGDVVSTVINGKTHWIDPVDGEIVDSTAKLKGLQSRNRSFVRKGTKFFQHGSLLIKDLPEFARNPMLKRETSRGKRIRNDMDILGHDNNVANPADATVCTESRLVYRRVDDPMFAAQPDGRKLPRR